jgi:hypothetical protein
MKSSVSAVALAGLLLAIGVAPASAGILYDNGGSFTGTLDAWGINFGNATADTFVLSHGATITGVNFVVWAYPGDTLMSIDWAIVSDPLGTTTYGSGTGAATTQTLLFTPNPDGRDIDTETFSIPRLALSAGTYWLLLQNAVVDNGDHIYWDRSDGPSQAWNRFYLENGGYVANYSTCGDVPCTASETFQIVGVPEPASFGLLAMSLLAMATLRRRSINQ